MKNIFEPETIGNLWKDFIYRRGTKMKEKAFCLTWSMRDTVIMAGIWTKHYEIDWSVDSEIRRSKAITVKSQTEVFEGCGGCCSDGNFHRRCFSITKWAQLQPSPSRWQVDWTKQTNINQTGNNTPLLPLWWEQTYDTQSLIQILDLLPLLKIGPHSASLLFQIARKA